MFFGVNIGPRLGSDLGLDINRHTHSNRNRVSVSRSKYGVPFTSKWTVEVQNISREISWQDLKDFCFNRTRIRPSHAEIRKDKGVGTLSCGTESDMKIVLQKLNGTVLNGKSLTVVSTVEKPTSNHINNIKSYSERTYKDRHHQNEDKNDTIKNDQHHKYDRRPTHRDIGQRNERPKDRDDRNGSSSHRRKDESKVIIHQANGDKVITECISKPEKDDAYHSENDEQTYFKRDRKTSHNNAHREGQGSTSHKNVEANPTPSKKKYRYDASSGVQTKWKIRVENLSSEVSSQKLREIIQPYADSTHAEAHKQKKGVGIVYVSTRESVQSVIDKLNNSEIKGKIVKLIDDSDEDKSTRQGRSDKSYRARSPHRSSQRTEKGTKTLKGK